MKILFICGSLKLGHDGVGDYTRRLAAECIRQGVDCRILALNDRHLRATQPVPETQFDGETPVECLRLSSAIPWPQRIGMAREWRKTHQPDVISLQFVPYSFHPKGTPIGLVRRLSKMGHGIQWHVMFHELWVGLNHGCSLKHRAIGRVQRHLVGSIDKHFRPRYHTHCDLYRKELALLGISACPLPLFGNIPLLSHRRKADEDDETLNFVLFGGIHSSSLVKTFIDELSVFLKINKKAAMFNFLGRNGPEKKSWTIACENAGIAVVDHGERPAEQISAIFGTCHFGIGSTPRALIQKSSSVASMMEHRLPIVCVPADWIPRGRNVDPEMEGIACYRPTRIQDCLTQSAVENIHSLRSVASKFLCDLRES